MRLSRVGVKSNHGIYAVCPKCLFIEVAMGNNCLIGTLTLLKALKTQPTYLRILPQTQQPLTTTFDSSLVHV